jgi:large subunit ribosomal protein L20
LPRVKRGVPARQRHKKILDISKGTRGTSSKLFRRANESMLHALSYATRDRRDKKRDMRQLWIIRINAGARENGMSYSRLVEGLRLAGVTINRKMLADLAITDPQAFAKVVEVARQAGAAQAAAAATA